MTKQIDPWAEQANLNTAVETGAIFTHDRTGWKFKVRYVAPWSKYIGKAAAIVYSRPDVAAANKIRASGETLTPEEEAILERAELELNVRATFIGWSKNVTGSDRKPLPFNIDNAMKIAEGLPQIWIAIQRFSVNAANFSIAPVSAVAVPEEVDAAGNSSGTSDLQPEDSSAS